MRAVLSSDFLANQLKVPAGKKKSGIRRRFWPAGHVPRSASNERGPGHEFDLLDRPRHRVSLGAIPVPVRSASPRAIGGVLTWKARARIFRSCSGCGQPTRRTPGLARFQSHAPSGLPAMR